MCVSVAVSFTASSSWPAVTVTLCAVDQVAAVNVRLDLSRDRSVPDTPPIVTVTGAVGAEPSFTV